MSKYDWTNVPNEVEWIATDSNGVWCEYTHEPKLSRYGWSVDLGEHIFEIHQGGSPFKGDWRDSLEERPK